MSETIHIVVIGDGAVGKTCLLYAYTEEQFKTTYVPTIYDKEQIEVTLDGVLRTIHLHDTAGQEDYDRIRQSFYRRAHCFLICYSLDSMTSYENIKLKWMPEIKEIQDGIPIILVGTKLDLRPENGSSEFVSTEMGEKLKRKINANSFVECSAKEGMNVKLAIHEAVRASIAGVPESDEDESHCLDLGCFTIDWCW